MEIIESLSNFLQKDEFILALVLGGSRSRGTANKKSDYDLFIVTQDNDFDNKKLSFSQYLEKSSDITYAAELGYIEHWGYMFKAMGIVGNTRVFYDISILPLKRIDEMALRNTNIIIFDKKNVVKSYICQNDSSLFETSALESCRKTDYIKLFCFEYIRFQENVDTDIFLAIKALERMKVYYMHYMRIINGRFSNVQHCPEKKYGDDFPNDSLFNCYSISMKSSELKKVCETLTLTFSQLIADKSILLNFGINGI